MLLLGGMAVLMGACAPGLSLLGAALGGMGDRPVASSGPFGGAPSAAQNGAPRPVAPLARATEGVAAIDDAVGSSCLALLPDPPAPLPAGTCALRPACLPGATRPITLRICAANAAGAAL